MAEVIEQSDRTDQWVLLDFIVSSLPDREAQTGSNNKQTAENKLKKRCCCLYRQIKKPTGMKTDSDGENREGPQAVVYSYSYDVL